MLPKTCVQQYRYRLILPMVRTSGPFGRDARSIVGTGKRRKQQVSKGPTSSDVALNACGALSEGRRLPMGAADSLQTCTCGIKAFHRKEPTGDGEKMTLPSENILELAYWPTHFEVRIQPQNLAKDADSTCGGSEYI